MTVPAEHDPVDGASLTRLTTETRNPASADLDTIDTLGLATLINDQDAGVAGAIRPELPAIARAIDAIADRIRSGGRLLYIGAGTSGRLGVLDASECPPTFNTPPGLVVGLIAGGDVALRNPVEAVEDQPEAGAEALHNAGLSTADAVVGIASSGRTPFVLGAVAHARDAGALTIGLSNTPGSTLSQMVDMPITPVVGPEVLTGSTRMKAGTAQKMVLNTLSTGVMVRLGKTYGNLMVDVQPTNAKLRARARRIVSEATGISGQDAATALAQAGGDVKVAIVSRLLGIPVADARRRLDSAGGVVRRALSETPS